ncbi:hypothetical protein [Winogradskyella wichelsiae]|uniref:hypothetical protein n=1 Tax=Winogradskyella wichelsiae TaxID=2697007 RepID=UPI0015C80520|nr:hypothetical protein [Winogradskyella wichelsiae]
MKWRLIILLCRTLGSTPFFPEPYLIDKIRWVAGGANGMTFKDYVDVINDTSHSKKAQSFIFSSL